MRGEREREKRGIFQLIFPTLSLGFSDFVVYSSNKRSGHMSFIIF